MHMVRDATGEPLASLDRPLAAGLVGLEDILTSKIHGYAFVAFDRTRVHARWAEGDLGWEDLWFFAACFDDVDAMYHLDEALYEYRRRADSVTNQKAAADYFLRSARQLRAGLESGEPMGIRNASVRDTMVRYLRGHEHLEALYLQEESTGRYPEFLDFVADHRDQFYRIDSWVTVT
jgi:hypothetical protein